LNEIGKAIFWLMEKGQFFLACLYVRSELNISDKFTRESPGLEASLTNQALREIWNYFGPFQWDLMATFANVNKDLKGEPLLFFSRYYDEKSEGTDILNKTCICVKRCFAFLHCP
jgi:hypothetical protein